MLEKPKAMGNDKELELIAQGNTAEVYKYGENKVLKLFRENLPKEPITEEYEKVKYIQSKLYNIPKAYEMIEYRGRQGIIYEKAVGTDMIKCMLKNVFGVKRYSRLLADIHFEMHKTSTELSHSVKDKLGADIDAAEILFEEEKSRIKNYLWQLPDGNSLLHFDFHPGNIIMQNNKPIIIDWMTACTGDPCADVARSYLLFQYGELRRANWLVNKLVGLFERYIGKIYIGEYKRLSGISDKDIKRWILPVAAGRLMEWISDNEKKQLLELIRKEMSGLN